MNSAAGETGVQESKYTQGNPAAAFTAQTPSSSESFSGNSGAISNTTNSSQVATESKVDTKTVDRENGQIEAVENAEELKQDTKMMESSTASASIRGVSSAPTGNTSSGAAGEAAGAPLSSTTSGQKSTNSSRSTAATSTPKSLSVAQTMTDELEYNKKHNPLWKANPSSRAVRRSSADPFDFYFYFAYLPMAW